MTSISLPSTFNAGSLPTQALDTLRQNALSVGGSDPAQPRGAQFAGFNGNNGAFTFGRANMPVDLDLDFIVPVHSLEHGWLYWQGGRPEKQTEVSVSAFRPFPAQPDNRPLVGTLPKPNQRDGWTQTVTFDFVGFHGAMENITTRLQHSSYSVRQCWGDIAMAVVKQDEMNPGTKFLHPVIKFHVDSYEHKSYSRTVFSLGFTLRGWTNGNEIRMLADEPEVAGGMGAPYTVPDTSDDILG